MRILTNAYSIIHIKKEQIMGLFSAIWSGVKSVGKTLLSAFNPFNDDDYRSASREDQDRFKEKIEVIAKDESLEHEYRMEAQRALAKIEAYRHAEEMARIEGTTKITLAKVEATSSIAIAKIELLKVSLEQSSKKELALIHAIEHNPSHVAELLVHLKQATEEKQQLMSGLPALTNKTGTNISNPPLPSLPLIKEPKRNKSWKVRLVKWAQINQVPRHRLPRKRKKLLQLRSLDLSHLGLTKLPSELAFLTNLKTLKASGNQLSSIPANFDRLINLTLLDVRDNPISSIPECLCRRKELVLHSD